MGLIDSVREGGFKKALEQLDIRDTKQIRKMCGAFAAMERERREVQAAHLDALDVDIEPPALPDDETRIDQLVALIEARVAGDPWDYWAEFLAPSDLENVERAQQYAGMADDEWSHRVSKWADVYRDHVDESASMTDRELASLYTQSRFGVDIDRFEQLVVDLEAVDVLDEGLRGPTARMDDALATATSALQQRGEE